MKKTIFFSDIMGTIFGNSRNIESDYDKFNELLKRIAEQDQSDKIVFSLISTDSFDIVKKAQDTIKPYIQDTVEFGRQYYDKGYYMEEDGNVITRECSTKSKPNCIIEFLNEIGANPDEISSIYFLDDVKMYHVMLSHLIDKSLADRLHCIMPVNNEGLVETNQLLEKAIDNHKEFIIQV